jgi:hypothetical protein
VFANLFRQRINDIPEDLRKAIRAHDGIDDREKKKSSKKTGSLPFLGLLFWERSQM